MAWEDVRDAIQDAVSRASGLPPEQVLWSFQDVNQPPLAYIAMSLNGLRIVGQDHVQKDFDASRPNGQEFRIRVTGEREVTLNLQAFTAQTVSDDEGHSDAMDLADRTRAALYSLPSIRARLNRVGVSVWDPGPINYIPSVVAAGFRGRATTSLICYCPAQVVEEYTGYIARISGTVTIHGGKAQDPYVVPYSQPPV